MSNIKKHLESDAKAPKGVKIGIAVSDYNAEITDALFRSCVDELALRGVSEKNIQTLKVPGAFELPFACKRLVKSEKSDVVIALGAVIKGQTPHFDCIAFAVSQGIMELNIKFDIPVVFGVLTTNNLRQAKARIRGGDKGDKGIEAALTAIKMLNLFHNQ